MNTVCQELNKVKQNMDDNDAACRHEGHSTD